MLLGNPLLGDPYKMDYIEQNTCRQDHKSLFLRIIFSRRGALEHTTATHKPQCMNSVDKSIKSAILTPQINTKKNFYPNATLTNAILH